MKSVYYDTDRTWPLPPLILHPFSDSSSPNKLVQSSRASLMLQGLLPNDEFSVDQLEEIILEGRFCEVRMLFYVGKDVLRWIDQCAEFVDREDGLRGSGILSQSFAALLIDDPPQAVREKLAEWGVQDYRAIFSRGIGLNSVLATIPPREQLASGFIRNYHYYADQMYTCWQNEKAFSRIRSGSFPFDLYASGEYSRMLEREWGETSEAE